MIKHATTFPGGLHNTSFVFMMNEAKYNSLSTQDKAVVDKQDYLETEWAASAQVKGLKDPKAMLAEFRAEIAKFK